LRLENFFKHCYHEKWLTANPTWSLEPVKAPERKREIRPITSAGWSRILAAVADSPKLRAFVMLLRFTGMRIGDIVTLRRSDIRDGRLVRKTQKRGVVVSLKLNPAVLDALREITPTGEYFFWTGDGKPRSAVGDYQRALRRRFGPAGISAYARLFRHTLVSELLAQGVPVYDVAKIIGHKSSKTTETVYAHWIAAAQERLDAITDKAAASLGDVQAPKRVVTIGHKMTSRRNYRIASNRFY
jgi:integrase